MLRNGSHVVFTQMVSSHEAATRGSVDFPNLVNIPNIDQNFVVELEVFAMVKKPVSYKIHLTILLTFACWQILKVVDEILATFEVLALWITFMFFFVLYIFYIF